VVGTFGEKTINENGEKLQELADFNKLKITNTFFCKKDIHKYTWTARDLRSLMDYIIVNRKLSGQVIDTNVLENMIFSDHYLVISKIHLYIRWKSQKKRKTQNSEVFKVHLLERESICNLYQERTNQYLQTKSTSENMEEEWENLKEILTKAAKEGIGQKRK
jgi:ABC-type uncharacterized transport system ATPase subunit